MPGHKCNGQLYSLVLLPDPEEEEDEEFLDADETLGDSLNEEVQAHISLNALSGVSFFQTMRVIGFLAKQHTLHILIDSGSTHNFLDIKMAKRKGCKIGSTCPLTIFVPGGKQMVTINKCKDFQWQLYGHTFTADVMLLPLGGSDMVLGIQWLSTLGDIKWNFQELKMEFFYNNKRICLRGTNKSMTHWLDARKQIEKMDTVGGAELMMMSIYPNTGLQLMSMEEVDQTDTKVDPKIQEVLDKYAEVFAVPNKLPPVRQLNKHTIKDKFPIPVIEELINELCGAKIFSKLDLRSGYHQIRMYEDDIAKTALKTYEGHYEFLVMSFGLINAPSTFQALMNDVFRKYLRKFTLVFFDDILIYSKSLKDHVIHLTVVLAKMKDHSLYAKESKYVFGTTHVEYLGHVISAAGVATDLSKIQAMQSWPIPNNIKKLTGFLGLTGYYRRFIKNFASISKPLTQLLKKNSFKWNEEAYKDFMTLKEAMVQAPVLALPNFNKPFVVEIDASGSLSTYEKEFLAVLMAIEKWRGYLLDNHFIIKTNHYSLKYVLDQKITTPAQMKWLPKLMGFDYEVVYKKGKDNVAADALSRRTDVSELFALNTTSVSTDLYQRIVSNWSEDEQLQNIILDLKKGEVKKYYVFLNNQLLRKGKLVVGRNETLRKDLLSYFHDGDFIGHSDVNTALQVAQVFLDQIFKLHRVPESIVSDRDKVFLREHPKEWFKWIPLAKLWYNSNYHSAIDTTPFEALYGQSPPVHVPYIGGLSKVDVVDKSLIAREQAIEVMKFHLSRAQNRMKQQAGNNMFEREFEVGNWVLLKLQPHRKVSIRQGKQNKFSPKYFGP
ncbi:transposon ty3-I gag-pol polyprotein [Tanacetum coccineum]